MNRLLAEVRSGRRISPAEAEEIYHWPLAQLGELADARRKAAKRAAYGGRGEEVVTYIVDRNINYTNVCDVYCKFCAFYRTEKDADHYVLSHAQIDDKIDELVAEGETRFFCRGAITPSWIWNGIWIFCGISGRNIRRSTSTAFPHRNSTILPGCSGCRWRR